MMRLPSLIGILIGLLLAAGGIAMTLALLRQPFSK